MHYPILIIPAYNPDEQLIQLLTLHKKEFPEQKCIVINDGSKPACHVIFKTLENLGITILNHDCNLGKGEAIKTGMKYFFSHYADNNCGIVTADADGQHSVADIVTISQFMQRSPDRLHLGVRQLLKKTVPLRSRIGNFMTRLLFNRLTHNQIQDTQTGLRGIPIRLIRHMTGSKSSGYDFEFEMFFVAKNLNIDILQTPIQTIYFNGNENSHFNPLLDSLKIYYVFFRFCGVALFSFFIDFTLFCTVFYLWNSVGKAMFAARIVSASVNFFLNKNMTFKSGNPPLTAAVKFSALALLIGFSSYHLLQLISETGLNIYTSKIIAECLLFIASFVTQYVFIFCKNRFRPKHSLIEA
jgi:putative flippase GtrA